MKDTIKKKHTIKKRDDLPDGMRRNLSLIAGRTSKMALTYIGSAICVAAVTAVDSLVAGVSIGSNALAAIAAAAPFLAIEQILHCLLGFGIDKLMIREIGKGRRKEADRVFGAVLIAVIVVYLAVYIPLLLFERKLLGLFMTDQVLIDNMINYTRPLFITAPVFEVLLCIERAFRLDGKAKLFALRSILTNIANIVFDILLVSVLGYELSGLAWSSVISTAIGYLVTISHFFSKKRSVSPDFSVICSLKEMWNYIKADIRMGCSAVLDEVMDGVALGAQTAVVGVSGGSGGLAIWAVYRALLGIVLSLSNGASASSSVYAGLLYGQKDYTGVRFSIRRGVRIALTMSVIALSIVCIFAGGISKLYGIEPDVLPLCVRCLRIGSFTFPAIAGLTVVFAYLPSVGRNKLTNLLVLIQKGLVIVSAGIGYGMLLSNYYTFYVLAVWIAAVIVIILFVRDRFWFVPERSPEFITDYSIRLKADQISAMSADAADKLRGGNYPAAVSTRVALVLEDSMDYVAQQNPGMEIRSDIQMMRHDNGIHVLIIDDGKAYNPFSDLVEHDWDEPGALEAVVVLGLTATANYDRVLDLNQLSLTVDLPAGLKEGT